MSKMYVPKRGEVYWYVDSFDSVRCAENDGYPGDEKLITAGNCFLTEEDASRALDEIKAIFKSRVVNSVQDNKFPKLTTEVFDRPDCPEWARYAAVDEDGYAWYFEKKPVVWYANSYQSITGKGARIAGMFDSSDWQNSLIERPVELPDWCKVGKWVYDTLTNSYAKVEKMDTGLPWANSHVTVRFDDNGSASIPYAQAQLQLKQACPRPYNEEEMKALVGKVIKTKDSDLLLASSYIRHRSVLWLGGHYSISAQEMLDDGFTIDGHPCGVLEHLENGEWVK